MSERWVDWVMGHSPYSGGQLVAHLVLALAADDEGLVEGLAHSTIAARARCSVGHIARLVRELEREQLVVVVAPPVGRRPAAMRLCEVELPAVDRALARGLRPVARAPMRALPDSGPAVDRAPVMGLADPVVPTPLTIPGLPAPPALTLSHKDDGAKAPRLIDVPAAAPASKPRKKRAASTRVPREHEPAARALVDAMWERVNPKPATPYIGVVKIAEGLLAAGWPADAIGAAMGSVPTISTRWVEAALRRARPAPAAIDSDRTANTGVVKL